jgi:hypothetical protein
MVQVAANLSGNISVPGRGTQINVVCRTGSMTVRTSAPLCQDLQYDLQANQQAEIIIVPGITITYTAGTAGAQFDIATVV